MEYYVIYGCTYSILGKFMKWKHNFKKIVIHEKGGGLTSYFSRNPKLRKCVKMLTLVKFRELLHVYLYFS